MNLNHLILLIFFFAYKIETGKIRQNFEEIFGDAWDKNGSEENMKIEQNQEQNELSAIDQNSGENGTPPNDQQKIETIQKFERIKEKLKEKGKYEYKNRNKIECKIGKLLGANRDKIYKWKKEFKLNKIQKMKKNFYEEKKKEFIERFDEFKSLYSQYKQKEFVKELGISEETFRRWKKELLPNYLKIRPTYSKDDKLRMLKQYFEIKEENPKITDRLIANELEIEYETLRNWKKKFASISKM